MRWYQSFVLHDTKTMGRGVRLQFIAAILSLTFGFQENKFVWFDFRHFVLVLCYFNIHMRFKCVIWKGIRDLALIAESSV